MIQINLLPWREEARKIHKQQFFVELGIAVAATIFILLIMHIFIGNKVSKQQIRNSLIQQEITIINAKLSKFHHISKQKTEVNAQLQSLVDLHNNRYLTVKLLDELIRLVPKEVYLTQIDYKQHLLAIKGDATNDAQIDQFMDSIKASPWFTQPSLNEIVATQENKQYKKSFQIVTRLKIPQD